MKHNVNKLINAFCAFLLGILGFSACDSLSPAEYGTPHADFKFTGTVTDESGKPVKGIRVTNDFTRDTLYTDAEGTFGAYLNGIVVYPATVETKFEDVDGEENGGEFDTKTLSVTPQQTKKGSGEWYEGEYTVTANVSLEKKK